MAEKDINLHFKSDEDSVRRQIGVQGTDPIPDIILKEYEYRITMLHRGGRTGPLGTAEVMNMLRFLDIKPEYRPGDKNKERIDFMAVPSGTRVIANCPERGKLKGRLKKASASGMVSVDLPDQDMRIQTFRACDVTIDEGPFDEPASKPKAKTKESEVTETEAVTEETEETMAAL
jgi:hypothetical protein